MGTICSQRKNPVQPGKRRGRHFQLCRIAGLPRNGERCEEGGRWVDVKVALPVVLGLHGSLGTPRFSLCPASITRWPWIPKTLQPGTARIGGPMGTRGLQESQG